MKTRLNRRRLAFTLIELLVVIAIISILAGMLIPIISKARGMGRQKACIGQIKDLYEATVQYEVTHGNNYWMPLWITQLADLGYCGDLSDHSTNPPTVPSKRLRADNETDKLITHSVLICPADGTMGKDGCRPDDYVYDSGQEVTQYPYADTDPHVRNPPTKTPSLPPGTGDPNLGERTAQDTVPCSYIYEFNCEPCDWVYGEGQSSIDTDPSRWIVSGEFENAGWTTALQVVRSCDINGDGWVSWYEIKQRTIRGSKEMNVRAWGPRVPVLRCYWHVPRPYLRDDCKIIAASGRGDVTTGTPLWYRDE